MSFIKRSQLDLDSVIHNKEAIWLYAELFLGHHDGSCHGLWWFRGSSVKNSLRYWPKHAFLVKTWVVIPYSNRLEKLTLLRESFVQIRREFTEILTETCSLVKTWGCYPSFWSPRKVNPTSWRFRANPSRIHWDIDQNVQF